MDRLDVARKILQSFPSRGQEELSALLGQDITLACTGIEAGDRQAFFDQREGKLVLASIRVEGETPGQAWCVASLPDAVRLGGTLIMLPEEEIQERIAGGEFGDEAQDAFGEIINVLTGVLSSLFEKIYPDQIRMVKTGVEMVDALEAAAGGDNPFPEGPLVILEASGALAGSDFSGPMLLVFPQELFGDEEAEAGLPVGEEKSEDAVPAESEPAPATEVKDAANRGTEPVESGTSTEAAEQKTVASGLTLAELIKIARLAVGRVGTEVTGFLGQNVTVGGAKARVAPHGELFAGLDGQQVLAEIQMEAADKHQGWMLVPLSAAIRMGGTLIMLPDAELESRLASGEFGEEDGDAYGEIVNIVAGVFTTVFKEQCKKDPIRFVKTGFQLVDPLEIEAGGSLPAGEGDFLFVEGTLTFADKDLGAVRWFFPVEAFNLADDAAPGDPSRTDEGAVAETGTEGGDGEAQNTAAGAKPVVVLYCNDEESGRIFASEAEKVGFLVRRANLSAADGDELLITPDVRLVLLIMDDVGEKGLAAAIRIHALVKDRVPVLAAGPNWTRSMVLRAIKYGIRDILVTPAQPDSIGSKIREHAA